MNLNGGISDVLRAAISGAVCSGTSLNKLAESVGMPVTNLRKFVEQQCELRTDTASRLAARLGIKMVVDLSDHPRG